MIPSLSSHRPAPPPAAGLVEAGTDLPIAEAELMAAAQRMQFIDAAGGGPRLLARLLDPALQLNELAAHAQAQPGLALRVLRVANSPFYGQCGQVATLGRAAQLLGLQTLRGVAAAACFDGLTGAGRAGLGLDLAAFRQHGLATACASQALAQRLAPALAGPAFVAGLLHDLGLLLQWRLRPAAHQALLRCAPAQRQQAEQQRLGATHAQCGRWLMQAWGLPLLLQQAVAGHAELPDGPPDSAPAMPSLGQLLVLGEGLAGAAGHGLEADNPVPPAPADGPWAGACAEVAAVLPAQLQRLLSALAD